MTTDATYSRNDLEALSLGDLRKVFAAVTGLGPGTRKPATMIAAILDAQAEVSANEDDQEPEDSATVTASQEPTTFPDGSNDDQEPQGDQEHEPVKVKVSGTGSNEGSVLLCDLVSFTGTVAVVRVLGTEVGFRADSGEPIRQKKTWASAGWLLDVATLPEMKELTVEQLSEQKPTDLSLAQLRDLYLGLSGRSTTSESRTYLTQRVRLAREGRLPAGTRRTRSGEPTKVLPVSMPVSTVEALDEAWRRLGFPSRIAFIRRAISEKLQAEGEDEVAEMIGK